MYSEYVKLIDDMDSVLSMVRQLWMEARDDESKRKHRKRLDELLDERLRLMKARDAARKVTV